MGDWFPGADRSHPARVDGGSILGGQPKALWHDTETSVLPSYSTDFWPQMTIDPVSGHVWQHIPASRAGRALRNLDGGVQTNRWNVFQIEVIGRANFVPFHPVMRQVADWLHDDHGVPKVSTVSWRAYSASYGTSNGVRLSGAQWNVYTGHLAHMHAPENVHGDPGWPFPIEQILASQPEEIDEMTKEEFIDAWKELTAQGIITGQDSWADGFRVFADRGAKIVEAVGQTNAKLDELIALLTPAPTEPPVTP